MSANIIPSPKPMLGGADASPGVGGVSQLTVTGTWALNDTFNIVLTTPNDGRSATLGAGALTGEAPTYCLTYKKKLYLLGGGTILYFSALNEPTVFNDLNADGNGFIDLSSEYGFSDNLLAAAIFQGAIACFSRRSINIVAVDPNPDNYSVPQTLENIGTVNGASVRGIGDKDVLFCSDSGFRSLQVLSTNNKITPVDLGTPIDPLVQARLLSVGTSAMASVVEPISNRYWCSIGNLIYVFSYFQSSGVTAWSTYDPSIPVAPVSGTYSDVGGGVYRAQWSGLTVGKTYTYKRGTIEKLSTAPSPFSSGSTSVFDSDVIFVADNTAAQVEVTLPEAPTNVTSCLAELFVPEKFVERVGQVYVRGTNGMIYQYGGSGNATYDATVCAWETPWLDAKSSTTSKLDSGVDCGMEGGWALSFGADYVSGLLKEVFRASVSSFAKGVIPSSVKGTHMKFRAATTGSDYARFSTLAAHFNTGDGR